RNGHHGIFNLYLAFLKIAGRKRLAIRRAWHGIWFSEGDDPGQLRRLIVCGKESEPSYSVLHLPVRNFRHEETKDTKGELLSSFPSFLRGFRTCNCEPIYVPLAVIALIQIQTGGEL